MKKHERGFGVVEIVLIIVIIVLIVAVGWLFFTRQNDQQTSTPTQQSTSRTSTQQTTIYPNNGSDGSASKDAYTVTLPSGWTVENVFEPYDIVKTVGGDKYLISSFIEESSTRSIMDQRVAEGIETINTVKTNQGTEVNVLKTPTTMFLASCVPTGDNCYLQLNGNKLYIHLYKVIPGAQSATPIDYSSESAKEIVNDFQSIAKSLSI